MIRNRLRAVPVLVWMVLIALLLRLAVIPFNSFLFENLMDANHIHAWEQGNVARALLAGHGFGSPFVSNQPSAIMPPVYPLIVAGFSGSSACTRRVDLCRSRLRLPDQRAGLHSGLPDCAAQLWRAGGASGRHGHGLFSLRHLLFRSMGVVHAPAAVVPAAGCSIWRRSMERSSRLRSVGWLRPARRLCGL